MSVARTERVSKLYHLGSERTSWRSLIPGPTGERTGGKTMEALHDISIDIERGEAIGIIGDNGAGKSTLLRVLGGIVEPTSGTVEVLGRVAPVIELGVGFDPELSGEENLEFAGALLGLRPSEVRQRRDEIVSFAELEHFMDTPLKRYSTGMRARLGFSLATSVQADLVLLDEVLSVGDWMFQRRCIERVRTLHDQGASIVVVSHNPWLMTQICDRVIHLDHGRIVEIGDPTSVVERYIGEEAILDTEKDASFAVLPLLRPVPGSAAVRISELSLEADAIEPHDRIRFRFRLEVDNAIDAMLVMSIYTLGRAVFADPAICPGDIFAEPGCYEVSGTTDRLPFSPGGFKLRVAAVPTIDPDDLFQEHLDAYASAGVSFRVTGELASKPGLLWHTDWSIDRLDEPRDVAVR